MGKKGEGMGKTRKGTGRRGEGRGRREGAGRKGEEEHSPTSPKINSDPNTLSLTRSKLAGRNPRDGDDVKHGR